jgi:uridine kinase
MFPAALVEQICAAIDTARAPAGPTLVAIDGPGCSGKSTLAQALENAFGERAATVGIDGFFVPFAEQALRRAPDEDLANAIPHLRWCELERDVIQPLAEGRAGQYRPYDWERDVVQSPVTVPPTPIVLVEGLYALHEKLRSHYRFAIWLDVRRDARMSRVEARDGRKLLSSWDEIYVPREWSYLTQQKPFEHVDLLLLGPDLEWSTTAACFSRQATR